jgi:hypothetical protein
LSSVLGEGIISESAPHVKWGLNVVGCCLILFSQLLCAIELTIDEIVLQDSDDMPPLVVVGIQGAYSFFFNLFYYVGFWGVLLCTAFMLPLLYFLPGEDHGHYEDHIDTFFKIFHSKILAIISIVFFICIFFFNYGAMALTQSTTAVLRSIYEMMRFVLIYYFSSFFKFIKEILLFGLHKFLFIM